MPYMAGDFALFADIRSTTHTLDPEAVERMITPRTTGIIGVHMWGQSCDVMDLPKWRGDTTCGYFRRSPCRSAVRTKGQADRQHRVVKSSAFMPPNS